MVQYTYCDQTNIAHKSRSASASVNELLAKALQIAGYAPEKK